MFLFLNNINSNDLTCWLCFVYIDPFFSLSNQFLNRLKILNLSYSVHLSTTPHFMGLPCLERIILTSLVEVHQSTGHLDNLTLLNLEGCKSLKNLPESICYLKCLETLNISRCINLEKLPEQLGDM